MMKLNSISGDVRVYYDTKQGAVSTLNTNLESAAPGTDFIPVVGGYITISDGENFGTIVAQIKEDSVPEVDEVFIVQITQLQLLSGMTSNFQPVLGKSYFFQKFLNKI